MLAAINGAKTRIDMETYQFDTACAALFAPLLLQKSQQGVQIHLMYDAGGSSSQNKALFHRMRASAIQIVEYNPIGSGLDIDHTATTASSWSSTTASPSPAASTSPAPTSTAPTPPIRPRTNALPRPGLGERASQVRARLVEQEL